MSRPDIRIIVLPKSPWDGCMVELLNGIDTRGAIECRLLDGPEQGRELWLQPSVLKEPVLSPPGDVTTGGEW